MSPNKEKHFMQLLEDNKYRLLRICRIYAPSAEEQQDLYQEVVFHLWKSFDSLENPAYASTWFYRVALNVGLQVKRRSERSNRNPSGGISFVRTVESAHELLEKEEQRNHLHRCIAQLNESDRALILLYLEGVANQQIAEIMGLTANHVAVRLKRTRKKLRQCFKPENEC